MYIQLANSIHTKRSNPLHERAPILGLPSIPIVDPLVGPIVTPILGGGNGGQQPTTTTQQRQPTSSSQPSPPTTATPPPNASNGSGSAGTRGGGGTAASSGNGIGNGGKDGNVGSNGASSGTRNANGGGSAGGGSTAGGSSSTGNSSSNGGGNRNVGSNNSGGTGGGNNNSDSASVGNGVNSVNGSTRPIETSPGSNTEGPNSLNSSPVHVGDAQYNTSPTSTTGTISPSGRLSSAIGIPSGESSAGPGSTRTTSDGGNGGGTTGTTGATSGSFDRLTPGAIAGIVIPCLVVLFFLVIFIRRRCLILTRLQSRNGWAGSTINSRSNNFGNDNTLDITASTQSSFGTSYDHSHISHFAHGDDQSSITLPHTAELRDTNVIGILNQRLLINPRPPIPINIQTPRDSPRRESNDSVGSGSVVSDNYSEAPEPYRLNSVTPMSVRPFSPSESFAFPKPPSSGTRDSWQSVLGRNRGIADDPFTHSLTSNAQVIQRFFLPSENANDELAVAVGDRVFVIQVSDDGWVAVRKNGGNGTAASGLIPAECFCRQGPLPPEFVVAGYGYV